MILVVAKYCASGASFWVLCDSIKLSMDKIKNIQCCLAGRHAKCGYVSIKQ